MEVTILGHGRRLRALNWTSAGLSGDFALWCCCGGVTPIKGGSGGYWGSYLGTGEAHSDIAVSGIRRALVLSLLRLGERSAVTECGVGHAETTTGGESAETWAAHRGQARSSAVTAKPACHGAG